MHVNRNDPILIPNYATGARSVSAWHARKGMFLAHLCFVSHCTSCALLVAVCVVPLMCVLSSLHRGSHVLCHDIWQMILFLSNMLGVNCYDYKYYQYFDTPLLL